MPALVWFVAGIALLILELLIPTGYFAYLCIGFAALAVGLLTLLGLNHLTAQIICFALLAPALLYLARALLHKAKIPVTPTNVDAMIGAIAIVDQAISDGCSGRVRLYGSDWLARSAPGMTIPRDARVRIVSVEGSTLIVTTTHNLEGSR